MSKEAILTIVITAAVVVVGLVMTDKFIYKFGGAK